VWLDLLLTHCVEEHLGKNGMTFLYDYPESQSALARLAVNSDGQTIAKRFELYMNGIELANGYYELTDSVEQMRRFESDNQQRLKTGEPAREIDTGLVAALDRGLPNCSGVALGIDRLLLLL
jgi:lysyl-tRNA synthetase class 2